MVEKNDEDLGTDRKQGRTDHRDTVIETQMPMRMTQRCYFSLYFGPCWYFLSFCHGQSALSVRHHFNFPFGTNYALALLDVFETGGRRPAGSKAARRGKGED